MNETLEAIARALFKSWFVNFEPVRAKMEGRDVGLPEHLAVLFPNTLDAQGIPKGWTSQRLDRLFDVSIGRTPPRKERHHFVSGGMGETWLSIRTMGTVQTFATASEEDLTAEAVDRFRVPRIPAGTVMVSFKLTVGRVAIAAKDMHSNEAIAHLRARSETPVGTPFTYCYMKGFDYGTLGSTSSIATAVNSKSIKGIEMMLPDAATHAAFQAITQPIFDRVLTVTREMDALVEIRNQLLPKLVSGEVRLSEAERVVQDATTRDNASA
jgi:type I restriction enzyme S subunit